MNILYLSSPNVESVNDRLIVGLSRIGYELGEQLFTYPYKPNLYRSQDHHAYMGLALDGLLDMRDVIARLNYGFFDVALIANIWTYPELQMGYELILQSLGDTPCIVISQSDQLIDHDWHFLTVNRIAEFYSERKREKEYIGSFAIGWSELEERVPESVPEKHYDTFFAGAKHPEREKYIKALQDAGYANIHDEYYSTVWSEYVTAIRGAKVTFGLPGEFKNSDKMWEGAAQGCSIMNWNYNPSVKVRQNFTDGEDVLFFADEDDMIAKLEALLADEAKLAATARAALDHIRDHHLVQHTAKYLIDIVEALL